MKTVTIEEKLTTAIATIERVRLDAEALVRDLANLPPSPGQGMLLARASSMRLAAHRFLRGEPSEESDDPDDDPPTKPGTPTAIRRVTPPKLLSAPR